MKKRILFLLPFLLYACSFARCQDDSAESVLLAVLETDSDNYAANYRLGILYYEEAVRIINATSFDVDIITLDQTMDEVVELFKQSLPYLEKAYRLNPSKKEVLSGLSALYISLNELEKASQLQGDYQK